MSGIVFSRYSLVAVPVIVNDNVYGAVIVALPLFESLPGSFDEYRTVADGGSLA